MLYHKKIGVNDELKPIFVHWATKSYVIGQLSPDTTYNFMVKTFSKHPTRPASSQPVVLKTPADETTTHKPGPDVHDPLKPVPTVKLYPTTTTSTTTTPQSLRREPTSHAAALPDFEHTMKPPEEIYEPTVKPTNEWIPSREYIPKPDHGNEVVDKFCEVTVHDGITWPRTKDGKIEEKSCPFHLKGTSTWRCLNYGWENSGPDMSKCSSSWLEELENRDIPADEAADALCSKMRDQNMTSGDLNRITMKLLKLAQGIPRMLDSETLQERKRKMKKFKKAFMESSSRLLDKRNSKSWRGLSKQNRRQSATSLIFAVEEAGFQSAGLIEQGKKEVDVDNNLVMQVTVLDTQRVHSDIRFPSHEDLSNSNWEGNSDSITIPSKSLKMIGIEAKGPINIVFTLYMNLEELIQPQWNTVSTIPSSRNDGNYNAGTISDGNGMEDNAVLEINSKIISASIGSTKLRRRLVEPVRFTLEHLTATDNPVPVCSFWELDSSYLSGHWSQEGCKTLDTNSTHTTCECDHLTNFAILMDVTGTKLPEKHELALRVITFAGCVISIICLMLSWTTFMVFKNLQCDRNTIHKNLVLCLLLAEILFLGGIAQTEPKILCSIIAGALHYLFLGAFAWMCLEGVQLYVMLVEVFEQERSRVKWYYLFGYGAPAVVVAISAGVYHQGYGTARHCWLTTERAFIWSFVGPALAVMLINIVMLGIAIYTMCRHSNMSATMKERTKTTKFSAWVKGAVVLVVLLGLTWLLGVLYLNEESVVIAYLFTALNSFQGMFIFVFHCIKNEKVQKEYRKVARRTSWLPNCIRVNYGGYTGVASSSPIASSGSGHYLSKLFGQRRRSAASTNSSAKPFLSRDQHRRSDTENSSSRDSSMVPSSLNGYIYTPGQPNGKDHLAYKPSNKNGNGIITKNGPNQLTPCYETEGVVGDLSEYIDCSVVDSEFVSEYCRHNMQVSMEEKRYSTGSEDSKIIPASNNLRLPENDNLSTLSLASSSRKPASSLSSLETVGNPANDTSEYKLAGQFQKDGSDPRLNLHQYIIPNSRKILNNNHLNVTSVHENDNKKRGVGELKSSSMNKLTKPAHSLTSIPETETSPQHSSTPNIQYRLGFGYADSHSDSAPSTAASSPDSVCHHQNIPIGIYEDLTPSSTMGSPSSIKSSLPNLEVLSIECDSPDIGCPKRRHSSETDIQFSPFRFTSTEC
ncbi:unnamed protein product [Lymnaea stagnalis]|uniref:Latrophilin-3 n=1 Tax=Lymnaea stagnalis TaxID=6523 RepID=A0AAV2IMS9_LYMST